MRSRRSTPARCPRSSTRRPPTGSAPRGPVTTPGTPVGPATARTRTSAPATRGRAPPYRPPDPAADRSVGGGRHGCPRHFIRIPRGFLMSKSLRFAGLLLTTALVSPAAAFAQDDPNTATEATPAEEAVEPEAPEIAEPEVEISVPGGNEILVTGQRDRNITRSSDQVVSILSSAEIARTGEGDIAGALGRVTGLSVVGSGFVYVRGLGDRYSLALLNGSPLPSPEPLRRVVPLDLFPTGVIASSLVQKSYSVNFPGEFGGGVINLTTKATPDEAFATITVGGSWDMETTHQLGYQYYGSSTDWTGFDNGNRDIPPALQSFFDSGERISSGNVD